MAYLRISEGKRIYKCDGCGRNGYWFKGGDWRYYGSIGHLDACPGDVPTACSDACQAIVEEKIKAGEYVLPRLRVHSYHIDVVSERKGY